MVIASLIFAVAASTIAATGDGSGTEPKMRKTHLSPISTVTIRTSGATAPSSREPAEQCANFRLSYQEIREYINRAAEVTEHDYFHMLDWSPCYVSGDIAFQDGVTGSWSIQQYRAGSLRLSNGKTLYLYCPQCQAKAFPPSGN